MKDPHKQQKVYFLLFRTRVLIEWKTKLSVITRIYEANRKLWTIISEWSKYNYSCFGFMPKVSAVFIINITLRLWTVIDCLVGFVYCLWIWIYMNIGGGELTPLELRLTTDQLHGNRVRHKIMKWSFASFKSILEWSFLIWSDTFHLKVQIKKLSAFDPGHWGSEAVYCGMTLCCRQEFHQLTMTPGPGRSRSQEHSTLDENKSVCCIQPISTSCNEDTSIEFPALFCV